MKLWIAIVQDKDAEVLLQPLIAAGIETYAVAGTGGFLRRGNSALLLAVSEHEEGTVQALLSDFAQTRTETRTVGLSETAARELGSLVPEPVTVTVSGAVVFRLNIVRWDRW